MKDWNTLKADKNVIMNKHFAAGRNGAKINKVVVHHNSGNLTTEQCWQVWQTREASAHYQVEANGTIGQLVWDRDTAWHAGPANRTSIGVEHANNRYGPWTISEATLDNGAHLVAAICKFYGLGTPTWGVNVFPHKYFMSTDCPGEIAGSQNAAYMARARKYYSQMMNGYSEPAPVQSEPPISSNIDQLAHEVIAGKYGNGDARKSALGSLYSAVQARVNTILNGGSNPTPAKKSIDEVAREVLKGAWGNGSDRANRLAKAGYSYSVVQSRVNQLVYGNSSSAPARKSVEQLANEVIRGDWGNGSDRVNRLTKAGYNYNEVQALVNKKLQ